MRNRLHYDPLGDAVADAESTMKREMIEAVLETTAVELAVSITLMCIPIAGWALECINLVIQLIEQMLGKSVKKRVAGIMNSLKTDLANYQVKTQADVHAIEQQYASAAFPAAQKLALSNAVIPSVNGLDFSWSDITKPIGQVVSNLIVRPVQAAVKGVLMTGVLVSKMTGHNGEARILQKKEDVWDDRSQFAVSRVQKTLSSPEQMAADVKEGMRVVTGYNQVDVALAKSADIRNKAYAAMDAAKETALQGMNQPDYQAQLVNNLARAIRGDPSLMQEAQYYQTQTAAFAQQNGLASSVVVNTEIPKPVSALPILAGAAGILGLLFLRR